MGSATGAPAETPTRQHDRELLERKRDQPVRPGATATSPSPTTWTSEDTARLLAMGTMISTDAGIACMDAKYHYLFWRPVTAIRVRPRPLPRI